MSSSSAELLHAYLGYKEKRKSKDTGRRPYLNKENNPRVPLTAVRSRSAVTNSTVPSVFTELPAALEIRRSRSKECKRPHSSSSADTLPTTEDGRNESVRPLYFSTLRPPGRIASSLRAEELLVKVEDLGRRLVPSLHPNRSGDVRPDREFEEIKFEHGSDGNMSRASRIRRQRARSNLSSVVEEDERLLSGRKSSRQMTARQSKSEENLRRLAEDVRSSLKSGITDGDRPIGSARMVASIHRLQTVNETLVEHLRKIMAAYHDLRNVMDSKEESHVVELSKCDDRLSAKDSEVQSLRIDLSDSKLEMDNSKKAREEDATRTQIVEIKLAQALQRISKLQQENENLKSGNSARAQSHSSNETATLRRIMELETEVSKHRNSDAMLEQLQKELSQKDSEIALLLQREKEAKASLTARSKVTRTNERLAAQEAELTKMQEKLFNAETTLDHRSREMAELRHELDTRTRRVEKMEKDFERFIKEKDRAYEKIEEVRQESENIRAEDRKSSEAFLTDLRKEILSYKSRCDEAERELARWKIQSGENSARYRSENAQLKTRIDELAVENGQYRSQFEQITTELLSIDGLGVAVA